jgi:glutathionyl-hydroquinone reductase
MGQLVDGTWQQGPLASGSKGAFERPATRFRGTPTAIAAGRYHLYVSTACPWAHRTLITRALRGLIDAVSVTVVSPKMGDTGWEFRAEDPDPIGGATFLHQVYTRAQRDYTGRVTVPVLWDRETNSIVNNESRDVMRILDVDFAPVAVDPLFATLAPPDLVTQIDNTLDAIYQPINNGVYKAGFATSQEAYDTAVRELFAALGHWNAVLGEQRYLCGDQLTEADIALFTTLVRFDLVYYSHFKCNVKRIADHSHLQRFLKELHAMPAIAATCDLDGIKTHYYWSQPNVNPSRIVPLGPTLEI